MGARTRSLAVEQEPDDAVGWWSTGTSGAGSTREGSTCGSTKRSPIASGSQADQGDLDFLRTLAAEKNHGPSLPVATGDATTIGGIPVEARILEMVKDAHPAVTWHVWRQWFVGRAADQLVAVWKMPATYGLLDISVTEYDGAVWAFSKHFIFRMDVSKLSPGVLAKVRETMAPDPGLGEKIERYTRNARVVSVKRSGENGEIVRVGDVVVPREQYLAVLANVGKDVEWLGSGPMRPVVARCGGKAVALIMPIVVENTVARGQA